MKKTSLTVETINELKSVIIRLIIYKHYEFTCSKIKNSLWSVSLFLQTALMRN